MVGVGYSLGKLWNSPTPGAGLSAPVRSIPGGVESSTPPPTLQRLTPDWWTQNYGRSLTPVIAIRTTWSAKTVGLEEVVATMQSRWYPFSVIDE